MNQVKIFPETVLFGPNAGTRADLDVPGIYPGWAGAWTCIRTQQKFRTDAAKIPYGRNFRRVSAEKHKDTCGERLLLISVSYRYLITNSTRRLAARPSSVSLVATGSFGPRPS